MLPACARNLTSIKCTYGAWHSTCISVLSCEFPALPRARGLVVPRLRSPVGAFFRFLFYFAFMFAFGPDGIVLGVISCCMRCRTCWSNTTATTIRFAASRFAWAVAQSLLRVTAGCTLSTFQWLLGFLNDKHHATHTFVRFLFTAAAALCRPRTVQLGRDAGLPSTYTALVSHRRVFSFPRLIACSPGPGSKVAGGCRWGCVCSLQGNWLKWSWPRGVWTKTTRNSTSSCSHWRRN